LEQGSWPPPDDGLLLERSAVEVVRAGAGGTLTVKTPDGAPTSITVSGIVHDPSLAPADQERTGYGYLTPTALARLGAPGVLDELKIIIGDGAGASPARDTALIDAYARQTADWLTADGHQVHDILVPPPYTHPHQNQAETVILLFLGFAVAALVLAGLLAATTLGALLAQQVRQIGVLKAIGATTGQVLTTYLLMAAGIAVAATVLSLAPAVAAGMLLTRLVADLLNIDLVDTSVPASVWAVQVGAGLTVPILIALVPLVRASRITVRQALDRYGVDSSRTGTRRLDRWLTGLRGANRTLLLAARNAVRRRGRLALTLGLLTAGGALFTAGLNTTAAWRGWVDDGLAARAYDLEIRLSGPEPADRVAAALRGVDGVRAVQTTLTMPAAAADADGAVQVRRTYPDGSHGNFTLAAVPTGTDMLRLAVEDGRWLHAGDTDAVVLNQSAALRLGVGRTGDEVTVSVEGRPTRWRVVGLVSEVGGPATGYVTAGALDPVLGQPGRATAARIVLDPRAAADEGTTDRVERALAAAGFDVAAAIPTPQLRVAVKEHVLIFVDTLVALAALMAVVGVLGLAVTMGINVTERTREFGVMHA
ncbi:MAG TPA: ABC transporter permease, partial [Micromonospora sp.]